MKILKILTVILLLTATSCQKEFLDQKPNKSLLVPTTLSDFQALLDNSNTMNSAPGMGIIAADDFNNTADGLDQVEIPLEKNAFLWATDVYEGIPVTPDWDTPYQQIFYANIVLDGLKGFSNSDPQKNELRGSALFYRGFALYQLLQLFSKAYVPTTAAADPGVPAPLTSDVNLRPGRGTVAGTYQQLIADLQAAAILLPATVSFLTRPNRAAAYGMLARVYLTMQQYDNAEDMADKCLQINDKLLDYNTLTLGGETPFPAGIQGNNPEILFYTASLYSFYFLPSAVVAPSIAGLYQPNDLRNPDYLSQTNLGYNFKGSYTGDFFSYGLFAGLATDEIYLIRAECNTRLNHVSDALKDLNSLLKKRYATGKFTLIVTTDPNQLLNTVLAERRKELLCRGIRWTDLRRLNQDSRFAVTIKRNLNGTVYTLPPNSVRYVFPIPENEVNSSGIAQNPR